MTDYERGVEQASAVYKEAIREYVAENAKLRELSLVMLKCIKAMNNKTSVTACWECPMHRQFDELHWYCCLFSEARELGIEVGDD